MGLLTRYQRINIYTAQTPVILYVLSQLKLLANSYNESALTRTSHVPHDRKARSARRLSAWRKVSVSEVSGLGDRKLIYPRTVPSPLFCPSNNYTTYLLNDKHSYVFLFPNLPLAFLKTE